MPKPPLALPSSSVAVKTIARRARTVLLKVALATCLFRHHGVAASAARRPHGVPAVTLPAPWPTTFCHAVIDEAEAKTTDGWFHAVDRRTCLSNESALNAGDRNVMATWDPNTLNAFGHKIGCLHEVQGLFLCCTRRVYELSAHVRCTSFGVRGRKKYWLKGLLYGCELMSVLSASRHLLVRTTAHQLRLHRREVA